MKCLVLVLEVVSRQVLGKPATGKSAGCPAFLPVGRGGEESRPCNRNYISRKPRSVSAELHLPRSLPVVEESLKPGEGQNLFTIVNKMRKNCTVPSNRQPDLPLSYSKYL